MQSIYHLPFTIKEASKRDNKVQQQLIDLKKANLALEEKRLAQQEMRFPKPSISVFQNSSLRLYEILQYTYSYQHFKLKCLLVVLFKNIYISPTNVHIQQCTFSYLNLFV